VTNRSERNTVLEERRPDRPVCISELRRHRRDREPAFVAAHGLVRIGWRDGMAAKGDPFSPQEVAEPALRDAECLTECRRLLPIGVASDDLLDCLRREAASQASGLRWLRLLGRRLSGHLPRQLGELCYHLRRRRHEVGIGGVAVYGLHLRGTRLTLLEHVVGILERTSTVDLVADQKRDHGRRGKRLHSECIGIPQER
jgi:hypothetical protein